ncbi:MAG: hypothetical protein SLRJCFUN_000658 [Candidatus Fervidibacter sp.]
MRISPDIADRLQNLLASRLEASQRMDATSMPSGSVKGNGEPVTLSAELRLIQLLHAVVKQLPEVDTERVAQIQQQLEQGTYNPDIKAVAEAVLRELGV